MKDMQDIKPTHRKHLACHDYRERCVYHITLVCSDREPVLADNGFSEFTQCPGGLYDYCVNGQVLVLAQSELGRIERKGAISRQECLALNDRAKEITEEA